MIMPRGDQQALTVVSAVVDSGEGLMITADQDHQALSVVGTAVRVC
jgi:hypothetical protein